MMVSKGLIYQFDSVQVDLDEFRVTKSGEAVSLEPKAFEVLLFFIENPGRLIEKEELLNAVWKEAFVTQNALTRVIAQLRKGLGDDPKEARYIETVPTRGYRFIAEVELATSPPPIKPMPVQSLRNTGEPPNQNNENVTRNRLLTNRSLTRLSFVIAAVVLLVITVLVGRSFITTAGSGAPVIKRTTQITTWTGLDIYPAFSPDGNSIAYTSDHDGGFEIYVRQIARGGTEIKLTSDGGQNYEPAWSPDGRFIAYYNKSREGIWIIPALGGVPKQLTDFGSRPSWSPDGAQIAFQSDGLNDVGAVAFGAMSPSTLWIVSSDGGQPRQLTQPANPPGGHSSPCWSPDGKRMLFASYGIAGIGVYSISLDGGGLKKLAQGQVFDPIYSPDGQSIYFGGETSNAGFSLLKLQIDSASGDPIGKPVEIKSTGAMVPKHLRISADGKNLVYAMSWMENNLWSIPVSASSSEPAGAPVPMTKDTSYRKTMPVFSNDATKLCYIVNRTGDDTFVRIADSNGENQRDLLTQTRLGPLAGWFPDGRIAMVTWNKGTAALRAISTDSGRDQTVTQVADDVDWPKLSPDGNYLAYHSDKGGAVNTAVNTWILPINGQARQLTFGEGLTGFPCWSHDSKFLAVEMRQGESTQLGIIQADGSSNGQITFLTSEKGQSWPFTWSPDDDKIVFAGQRNGIWNIWWVSRSTKTEKQITNYTKPNAYVRYPAWSPKGDRIVYEYAETTGNIWVTEFR